MFSLCLLLKSRLFALVILWKVKCVPWSSTLISNNIKRLCLLMVLFVNLQTTTCRRILVPDTCPCLFYKFLGYLYSGVLDTRSLSLDEVTEMLALSDKYEVSLTDK